MKTLIVTGGKISADFALTFFENNEYELVIAADKGLEVLDKICIKPNYIIGDFDSLPKGILDSYAEENIIKLNPIKDYTDTEAAISLAINKNAKSVTIIGATGTRMDHVFANINLLTVLLNTGIDACIRDENNKIRLINKKTIIKKNNCFGNMISLIPYTDKVSGVTLEGFLYPLYNREFNKFKDVSLGISNELIADEGIIDIKSGIFILIEAKD